MEWHILVKIHQKPRLYYVEKRSGYCWETFFYGSSALLHFFEDLLTFERGRETPVWERNICVRKKYRLPLMCPLLRTWAATQTCAQMGNQTSDLWFADWCSIQWATPARAAFLHFCWQKWKPLTTLYLSHFVGCVCNEEPWGMRQYLPFQDKEQSCSLLAMKWWVPKLNVPLSGCKVLHVQASTGALHNKPAGLRALGKRTQTCLMLVWLCYE